jgi:hypothetical protein
MIARRAILAVPLMLSANAAGGATGEPDGGKLAFKVMRKGEQIGTNVVVFRRNGTNLQVFSDAEMKVSFGPITLFRYRLSLVETWRDGVFVELESATDNDGESLRLVARRGPDGIAIESSKLGRRIAPPESLPLTHWNVRDMTAPLFNPQDGRPMQLTVTRRGDGRVTLANSTQVQATRYALTGEATIDDWYDANNVWTALRAVATDGSIVEYQRLT